MSRKSRTILQEIYYDGTTDSLLTLADNRDPTKEQKSGIKNVICMAIALHQKIDLFISRYIFMW